MNCLLPQERNTAFLYLSDRYRTPMIIPRNNPLVHIRLSSNSYMISSVYCKTTIIFTQKSNTTTTPLQQPRGDTIAYNYIYL